ncbi:MAG: 3'-5' exonuclease [Anaerolineales bacterium]|nr:3'-5' exonuclease [Anaerolineales bacterium]
MRDWIKSCVSVDVETAGPYPGEYALLSIGACLAKNIKQTFYVELQPDREAYEQGALAISGLSMQTLQRDGVPPAEAMRAFAIWLKDQVPDDPICVAFNAPFDWMFLTDYFHRYLGSNPFGHSALDIKALAMGVLGKAWPETGMKHVSAALGEPIELVHNALRDAQDQADIFTAMMERMRAG